MPDGSNRRSTRTGLPAAPPDPEGTTPAKSKPEATEVVSASEATREGAAAGAKAPRRSTAELEAARERENEALLDNFYGTLKGPGRPHDKLPTAPDAKLPWSNDLPPSSPGGDTQRTELPSNYRPSFDPGDDLLVGGVPEPFDDAELPASPREPTHPDGTMVTPMPEEGEVSETQPHARSPLPPEPSPVRRSTRSSIPAVSPAEARPGTDKPPQFPREPTPVRRSTRSSLPAVAPPEPKTNPEPKAPQFPHEPTPAPKKSTRSSMPAISPPDPKTSIDPLPPPQFPRDPTPARRSTRSSMAATAVPDPAASMRGPPKVASPGIAEQATRMLPIPEDEVSDPSRPPPIDKEPTSLFQYGRAPASSPEALVQNKIGPIKAMLRADPREKAPTRRASAEVPALKAGLVSEKESPRRRQPVKSVIQSFTGMIQIGPITHLNQMWSGWSFRGRVLGGLVAGAVAIGVFTGIASILLWALTDRPNTDELVAAYPYGYTGQTATRGPPAPPAVEVAYTLEGQRPCGHSTTEMCLQYRYEGKNGFTGYMLLHKAYGHWQRFGLEGAPFDPERR